MVFFNGNHPPPQGGLSDVPFPLLLLRPPYDRFERIPTPAALTPVKLIPGSILALQALDPTQNWYLCPKWVPQVRAQFPTAPLILQIPSDPDPSATRLARRAGRLHVRAILFANEPIRDILRHSLTQPEDLGGDVMEWLTLQGLRLTPDLACLLHEIFSRAAQYRCIGDLLQAIHEPIRRARAQCQRRRLPPPVAWFQAAHALHAVLRLQADPNTTVSRVAWELDHVDHSALSQQIFRCFGKRPTAIRDTLGWEWLMSQWLTDTGCVRLTP